VEPNTVFFALLAFGGLATAALFVYWLVESRVKPIREHRDRLQQRILKDEQERDAAANSLKSANDRHARRLAVSAEARRLVALGRPDLAERLLLTLETELGFRSPPPPVGEAPPAADGRLEPSAVADDSDGGVRPDSEASQYA